MIPHFRIIIQFGSIFVEKSTDQLAYDTQSLIGEVGGTLGLLLGLSVYSIVELLAALAEKLGSKYCKNAKRRKIQR